MSNEGSRATGLNLGLSVCRWLLVNSCNQLQLLLVTLQNVPIFYLDLFSFSLFARVHKSLPIISFPQATLCLNDLLAVFGFVLFLSFLFHYFGISPCYFFPSTNLGFNLFLAFLIY